MSARVAADRTRKARPAPTGSLKHLKLVTQGEHLKLQRDL
jgi:hypothetical protein